MSYTITFGWWAIPAVLTLIFFMIAVSRFANPNERSFSGIWNMLMLIVAFVASLVVWLIWALIS